MVSPTTLPAWQALDKLRGRHESLHMRDAFAQETERFNRYSLEFGDLLFDYSKNRITKKTVSLLIDLARQTDLAKNIEAMFSGEKINVTEGRAV